MMQQYSALGVFRQGEMGYNIETQSIWKICYEVENVDSAR